MARIALVIATFFALATSADATDSLSFKDKKVTMVIGFAAGGGTDNAGRIFAKFLGKYLPGSPTIIVQNMPGAQGITSINYIVQQTKPDGTTILMGSSSQVDPVQYRSIAVYDPTKLAFFGGTGRSRSFVVINTDAEKRLYDKTALPVVMGSVGLPRSAGQAGIWGIEYLGWNARWIVGYSGTGETVLALQRGEIDLIATNGYAGTSLMDMLESGKFKILTQAVVAPPGAAKVPLIDNAPIFQDQMEGKIRDPIAKKAFDYWINLNAVDKWLGLAPGTPQAIIDVYRRAFTKMSEDPDFMQQSSAADDVTAVSYKIYEDAVKGLDATPPEAIAYIDVLLHKQGLQAQ